MVEVVCLIDALVLFVYYVGLGKRREILGLELFGSLDFVFELCCRVWSVVFCRPIGILKVG